ncbi:MAG: hypothetical protein HY579_04805 [Nitrospinae bacterium]|nr:hypothetical protein [Nitrospinota bacterium]
MAELCNLIYANLPERLQLDCEVQYSGLINKSKLPGRLKGARADLVVMKKDDGGNKNPEFIIEVKRGKLLSKIIREDLHRLAEARSALKGVRAVLFLISESSRPSDFVSEEGVSLSGKHNISDSGPSAGYYKVRRTFKAAQAFTKTEKAHYACLIEVYPNSQKRSSSIA